MLAESLIPLPSRDPAHFIAALKAIVGGAQVFTDAKATSTPHSDSYDREVVIINTMHIAKIFVIDDGRHVIACRERRFELGEALQPYGRREPHSVLSSSCIGASVVGGICTRAKEVRRSRD